MLFDKFLGFMTIFYNVFNTMVDFGYNFLFTPVIQWLDLYEVLPPTLATLLSDYLQQSLFIIIFETALFIIVVVKLVKLFI